MKLTDKQAGNLTIFCVVSCFAINTPVSKYLLSNNYISAYGLTIARMTFGAITFWLASLFIKKDPIDKKDHLKLFFAGILGIVCNQGFFIFGLSSTSPVDASIIVTGTPLFALIIAAIVLKEPITTKKASGVFIGMAGAIFLIYMTHHGDIETNSNMKGNIAIVCSSLSYATYLVISQSLTIKYSSITMMKWMFLYSAIILLPFFYKDLINAPLFNQSNIQPYLSIGFTLFFATFMPYMLLPIAQKKIRPTTISMYNNFQPLITSIIAILVGQDKFSIEKAISGIMILLGVYLVTQSKSKADLEKDKLNEISK